MAVAMWKRLCGVGVFWLSLCLGARAQGALPLETFTSPDSTFQFVYPQNYQLLIGDGILKATQGRHSGVSVCDFSTALACVIYPLEPQDDTRVEAAGFSVDRVGGVSAEPECLTYADQLNGAKSELPPMIPTSINGVEYHYVSVQKKVSGSVRTNESYRIFREQKCYELRIVVSLSDDGAVQRASESSSVRTVQKKSATTSLGDPVADSARDSLRLILWSFTFK